MAILNYQVDQISIFMFIFLRVTFILMFLPLFDNTNIPALFKIGLCFAMSVLFYPVLKFTEIPNFDNGIPLLVGVASEIVMGLGIGLSVKLVFTGIQMGGELVGYQMGLSMANVFDPATGSQNSILAEIQYIAAILVFLAIDGHHWFFRAVADSFILMPPFGFQVNGALMNEFLSFTVEMFVIAIKFSAPIIVALLFTDVSLGLIARTVPQMNVFFVAMPVKIIVGVLFIGWLFPLFISYLISIYSKIGINIVTFIKLGSS
ncbi:MAG: flagellar biosynthetic protein FliR [Proteobacteria bacterium]|nr:flagellar biosynthetic protein FliR [Pseudomonadota bacterium]MBU4471516.1 flagellar biosynthetic protein FliR [Pseudomonadota bacterium]MCG2752522.1 flagellar biosynthetic protein FliR [Desulfobacteraceae bacterium]